MFLIFKKLNILNWDSSRENTKMKINIPKIYRPKMDIPKMDIPKMDIYNGLFLSKKCSSIEHIIPKKFFNNKIHANDPLNLGTCHLYINNCRSDYKYGLYYDKNDSSTKCLYVPNHTNVSSGYLNTKKRIFYLNENADLGLISRSCLSMFYKYPYLYKYIDDIIHDKELLEIGSEYPKSKYEILREQNIRGAKPPFQPPIS
jgi:hypothetical protein